MRIISRVKNVIQAIKNIDVVLGLLQDVSTKVDRILTEIQHIALSGAIHGNNAYTQAGKAELKLLQDVSAKQDKASIELARIASNRGISQGDDAYTYAQAGEDSLLIYIFNNILKIPLNNVTFLDLGAALPSGHSNTYALYERGARGVLVEANPALIPGLKMRRPDDVTLHKCVSDTTQKIVPFYIVNELSFCSMGKEYVDDLIKHNPKIKMERIVEVETITATEIMDQYFGGAPTLLDIDIEGQDYNVLRSIDFNKLRPAIIVSECTPYISHSLNNVQTLMGENGYMLYAFNGINSFYLDGNLWRP